MKKYYLIKDLATLSGLSTDTIRFYEKRKLLHPSFRGDNNYRYYDENILKRIIFIKRCRSLDLSLNEIRQFDLTALLKQCGIAQRLSQTRLNGLKNIETHLRHLD